MKEIFFLEGLNELRFIAVFVVLVHHIEQIKGLNGLSNLFNLPFIANLGIVGVTLFFVISGFLIGTLLLKEKNKTKTINIKHFLYRRSLRILPLYYLVVFLGIFILPFFPHIEFYNTHFSFTAPILYIVLLPNIAKAFLPINFIGHLWTIGIELQFYLISPFIVKYVKKNIIPILLFLILIVMSLRFYVDLFQIESLLVGMLGAVMVFRENTKFLFNRYIQATSFMLLLLLVTSGFNFKIFGGIVYSSLFLILIANITSNPMPIIKIKNPVMEFLGRTSYGIYMYQIMVIAFVVYYIKSNWMIYLISFAAVIIISYLSYKFFESEFLKRRVKYSTIITGNNL